MKKASLILAGMLFLLVSLTTKAQTPNVDYFVGKWSVLVVGTPNGDAKSVLVLERKDGKMKGTLKSEGKEAVVLSRVEEKEKTITAYFTSSGYDVYLFLEKKDENNVTGSMMDMFDCTGIRVVETVTK